jgi:hypothetical protein
LEEEEHEPIERQEEVLEQTCLETDFPVGESDETSFHSYQHHAKDEKTRVVEEEEQAPRGDVESNPSLIKLSDLEAGAQWDENGMFKEERGENPPPRAEICPEGLPEAQGVPVEMLQQYGEVCMNGKAFDETT